MRRLTLAALCSLFLLLAACGGSSSNGSSEAAEKPSDNPMAEGIPSCDDLRAGSDMANFEQGCMAGDTIVVALTYDCAASGDALVYLAPDEDAGEIYYGVPGQQAEKGETADDFWTFMETC